MEIVGRNEAKMLQATWGELNNYIYTANEDATIRVYDVRVRFKVLCWLIGSERRTSEGYP
jgi:hypothetical protein